MAIKIKGAIPQPEPAKTDYSAHLSGSQSIASVSKQKMALEGGKVMPVGAPKESTEAAMESGLIPPSKLCQVTFGGGRKFNIGNYESMDVHVRVTVPCTLETLPEMYEFASDFVSEKMQQAAEEIEQTDTEK